MVIAVGGRLHQHKHQQMSANMIESNWRAVAARENPFTGDGIPLEGPHYGWGYISNNPPIGLYIVSNSGGLRPLYNPRK